ncbi:MAG: EAL domain-containing protein, partial [Clostridia bacterium]|nr:EAL domain-containing protein [Clostridia bacterium]
TYAAMAAGLVPLIIGEVEWTTPIILGGYRATGSIAGSIMQLVNVAAGVLIYIPFVKLLDRQSDETAKETYISFLEFFKKNEKTLAGTRLTDLDNEYGGFAKALTADLRHGIRKGVVLAYQPQYNYAGECIGAEALLRWEHPVHGSLYPPLIFKLAEEGGFLSELEQKVFERALLDRKKLSEKFGEGIKLSVNVTGTTVTTPQFIEFCRIMQRKYGLDKNVCLEVTEQTALSLNEDGVKALNELRSMDLLLAIDDFSMGQTSLHYLKDSLFDYIKLDGSLVTGLAEDSSYRNIVASITGLAESLGMIVLAEFVETAEQREILHSVGCDCYQGYLYSKAVFLDE